MALTTIRLKDLTSEDVAVEMCRRLAEKAGVIGALPYQVLPDGNWHIRLSIIGTTDELVTLALWLRECEIRLNLSYGTTDDY